MGEGNRDGASTGKPSMPELRSCEPLDRAKVRFAIDGRQFIAIPQEEWSRSRRKNCASPGMRAAGFVHLDGMRHVLIELDECNGGGKPTCALSSLLTSRELQIAYSVADGKCDKVIAHELGISEYTVREHMRRIFHKLNVTKRSMLVAQLITAVFEGGLGRG